MNINTEYCTCTASKYTKWWLRSRKIKPIKYLNNCTDVCYELYVPLWAWPLELLHRLFFGYTKLNN